MPYCTRCGSREFYCTQCGKLEICRCDSDSSFSSLDFLHTCSCSKSYLPLITDSRGYCRLCGREYPDREFCPKCGEDITPKHKCDIGIINLFEITHTCSWKKPWQL